MEAGKQIADEGDTFISNRNSHHDDDAGPSNCSLNTLQPDSNYSYTDFDIATAEAIAISMGRAKPNKGDFDLAVQKKIEWNKQRIERNLPEWI